MLVRFALGKQTVIFDPSVPWHRPGGMAAGDEPINLFLAEAIKLGVLRALLFHAVVHCQAKLRWNSLLDRLYGSF